MKTLLTCNFRLSRHRTGFTLIEILVVVSIIGVLVAVLLPVINSARGTAKRASCASYLKQIHLAMELYVADNRFYPPLSNNPQYPGFSGWVSRLLPYTRSMSVFECPAADLVCQPNATKPSTGSWEYAAGFNGAYDINNPYVEYERVSQENGGVKVTILPDLVLPSFYHRPTTTILLLDGDGVFVNPGYQDPPFQGVEGLKQYGVDAWHDEGCNVAFVDGHVKWLSLKALTKPSLWTASGPE